MERREFLKGAGVGVCAALLSLIPFPQIEAEPEIEKENITEITSTINTKDHLYINSKYIDQFRRELLNKSKQKGSRLRLKYNIVNF